MSGQSRSRRERTVVHLLAESAVREVQRLLAPAGIDIIVLKGPHLAHTVYEDPAERIYCDVDLLVRPDRFDEALACLLRHGHEMTEFRAGRLATCRSNYNYQLSSPNNVQIELHRSFASHNRYPFDIAGFFRRAQPFRLGGTRALGLCPEDLLFHLCLHAAKSYFKIEPKHLRDIRHLLDKRDLDWDAFLRVVGAAGCAAGSYYALLAARTQLGAAVPDHVLRQLQPRGWRRVWLDHHLTPDRFPVYRFPDHGALAMQARLAIPLMDRAVDWAPVLLRYSRLRLLDLLER